MKFLRLNLSTWREITTNHHTCFISCHTRRDFIFISYLYYILYIYYIISSCWGRNTDQLFSNKMIIIEVIGRGRHLVSRTEPDTPRSWLLLFVDLITAECRPGRSTWESVSAPADWSRTSWFWVTDHQAPRPEVVRVALQSSLVRKVQKHGRPTLGPVLLQGFCPLKEVSVLLIWEIIL